MPSDVSSLRYLLPKFKGNYTAAMKTLQHSCQFDDSDIAQYRLKVIEFGRQYGWQAVQDAFGVKRSTYFLWKQRLTKTQGRLTSLVPISTKPHRVRRMQVDPRIITFIKSVRDQYGRIGKYKLKILLDAYCQEIRLSPLQPTTIGKILHRYHFFYEGKRTYHHQRSSVLRVRKAPKENTPGYIEMDTVVVVVNSHRHYFLTAIDVVTKYAVSIHTTSASSLQSLHLLKLIHTTYQFPLRTIQTDNGSEFLGDFDTYCQTHQISHAFSYPRSPRINGGIERFNRTIQEEFINRSDSLYLGKDSINDHLEQYLNWYNETRPHQSLGYLSPNQYIQSLQSKM